MTQVSESLIYTSRNVRNTRVLSREIEIYGAAEVHYARKCAQRAQLMQVNTWLDAASWRTFTLFNVK